MQEHTLSRMVENFNQAYFQKILIPQLQPQSIGDDSSATMSSSPRNRVSIKIHRKHYPNTPTLGKQSPKNTPTNINVSRSAKLAASIPLLNKISIKSNPTIPSSSYQLKQLKQEIQCLEHSQKILFNACNRTFQSINEEIQESTAESIAVDREVKEAKNELKESKMQLIKLIKLMQKQMSPNKDQTNQHISQKTKNPKDSSILNGSKSTSKLSPHRLFPLKIRI